MAPISNIPNDEGHYNVMEKCQFQRQSEQPTTKYTIQFNSALGEITGENCRTTCDKKQGPIYSLQVNFVKKCTCKIGDFKIVEHVYM